MGMVFPVALAAQSRLSFDRLMPKDGLSQSVVTAVYQDSRGFLWVGTQDGLNRYDGKEFRVYLPDREDDAASLSNAYVRAIQEDSRGNLWIGTDGALDRLDRQTGKFIHYWLDSLGLETSVHRQLNVKVIYEDQRSELWIGTSLGLYRLDHQTGKPEPFSSLDENISGIYEEEGVLFVAAFDGLKRLNRETRQLEPLAFDLPATDQWPENHLRCVLKGSRGELWIGTWGQGLIRLDPATGRGARFFHDPEDGESLSGNVVSAIAEDRRGNLWIGTENGGLNLYDRRTGRFEHFLHDPEDPKTIISNNIMSLYRDAQDNLWIGSFGGLNRLDQYAIPFEHYRKDPQDPHSLSADVVTSVFGDSRGELWIGTWGGGLDRLDPATGRFAHYRHDPLDTNSISGNVPWGIGEDGKGNIWVGTLGRGLNRWDRRTGRFDRFIFDRDASGLSARNGYNSVIRDRRGRMWMSGYGVYCRDPASGKILYHWYFPESEKRLAPYGAISIVEDRGGTIWFGAGGLYCLDPVSGETVHYAHDPDDPASIADNFVKSVCEDRNGNIWAGTNAGLSRLDRATGHFENFGTAEGLTDNTVQAIAEDDLGYLWLNTDRALVRFDPRKKVFRSYDTRDGLPAEGMSMASWKDPRTGKLYFGSINGLIGIQPRDMVENNHVPPVVLTRFVHYHSHEGHSNPIADETIQEKEEVTLSYRDNVLEFEFAVLNFIQPWKNRYVYRLEGFHDQWINLGSESKITFTNLDPGEYVLRVKGANNDGVWNETGASLRIVILPPLWGRWWAYVLYGATFLVALLWFLRFQRKRVREKAEARRILELDRFKSRFYSNITHEFRTPLTIILGMAEQLQSGAGRALNAFSTGSLEMIRRNGKYLLHLINQMLDLSRVEAGQFRLHPVCGDLLPYLRYLLEPFTVFAAGKNIRIHLISSLETLNMDFDPDAIRDIVSNLLSNAIKYTPEGGDIYVSVLADPASGAFSPGVLLKIRDTGIGIPADKLLFIFDRFFKVEDSAGGATTRGTGVGLALTRELVKLAGGEIGVTSTPGKGTEFTVRLPVTEKAPPMMPEHALERQGPDLEAYFSAKQADGLADTPLIPDDQRPLLLIIEDNADVVQYLSYLLEEDYRIVPAFDGPSGMDKALEMIPDLVISDVMLPGKDGFEICKVLKNDERTSHIPIVLLSAKADTDSRVKGLEFGADAYLVKPFQKAELEIRLRKLNERQKKLRTRYGSLILPPPSEDRTEQREDAFLKRVNEVLEAHLDDENFHIEDLCETIHISRTQLFRKLTALTGRSASHYLRGFRLHKAREMLRNTDLNISEIAFEVGYKDPSYFTRTFVEEFGYTPSAFRERV